MLSLSDNVKGLKTAFPKMLMFFFNFGGVQNVNITSHLRFPSIVITIYLCFYGCVPTSCGGASSRSGRMKDKTSSLTPDDASSTPEGSEINVVVPLAD